MIDSLISFSSVSNSTYWKWANARKQFAISSSESSASGAYRIFSANFASASGELWSKVNRFHKLRQAILVGSLGSRMSTPIDFSIYMVSSGTSLPSFCSLATI